MTAMRMVLVRWLDSCMLHSQVDGEDLPAPSEMRSVGWLSLEEKDYVVVSRDRAPEGSYAWRSSLAIPRQAIIELVTLTRPVEVEVHIAASLAANDAPAGSEPDEDEISAIVEIARAAGLSVSALERMRATLTSPMPSPGAPTSPDDPS